MRLAALMLLLCPATALADPAEDLTREIFPPEAWNAVIDSASAGVAQQAAAADPSKKLDPGVLREAVRKMLPYEEVVAFQAGLLRKFYDAEEVQQLATFYRSPLGKKMLRVMPQVSAEVGQFLMRKIAERAPTVLKAGG